MIEILRSNNVIVLKRKPVVSRIYCISKSTSSSAYIQCIYGGSLTGKKAAQLKPQSTSKYLMDVSEAQHLDKKNAITHSQELSRAWQNTEQHAIYARSLLRHAIFPTAITKP